MKNSIFKNIKAVIFDMDGVLIDSEKVMAAAAAEAFNRFGVPAKPEDFEQFCGTGEISYFGGVAGLYGGKFDINVRNLAYKTYFEKVRTDAVVYPCVYPALVKIKEAGIPMAVASSADFEKVYANIDVVLRGAKPESIFRAVITGNDVKKNKPDPEIFLKAAEKLGFAPEECIIFEDSLSGVRAAKASGAFCCGVTTANTAEKLTEAGADMVSEGIDIFCSEN